MAILRRCMCWTVQKGAYASAVFVMITSIIALIMVVIDTVDWAVRSWQMPIWFAFDPDWRMHVWKGFLACNIVMFIAHIVIITASAYVMKGLTQMTIDQAIVALKAFCYIMIVYILIEGGIVCYEFSWYGINMWRFVWQVFWFMFWVVRLFFNIWGTLCIYSRAQELEDDLFFDQKGPFTHATDVFGPEFEMKIAGISNPAVKE